MAEVQTPTDTVRLQVAGAQKPDFGKSIARLSQEAFAELGIGPGAIVSLTGKRTTAAVAVPPYPADVGLSIIRLDGLLRANAGIGMGDTVEVAQAEVSPAQSVVLAPAQPEMRLNGPGGALLRPLIGRPMTAGDTISTAVPVDGMPGVPPEVFQRVFGRQKPFGLQEIRLVVVSAHPRGIVQITDQTDVTLLPEYQEPTDGEPPVGITYDDVGGLGDTVDQVREMIELPLKHPELFSRLGIDPPKGVLLYGPPGTGKTLLARAVANETNAHFSVINGPEIMGRYYGESEERLRSVFEEASQNAPAIIFIDELDSIAPARDETGEAERRVVAQLLTLLDGLEARGNVVVIGATNRPDAIDEALRRPGRFDREIVIGVPDTAGRREIIGIHTRGMPLAEGVDLEELARTTYGFVGADLGALAREAAISALRRILPDIDLDEDEIPADVLDELVVRDGDFRDALRRVQPSALREIQIQVPNVGWADIGGLEETKSQLQEGIELPLKHPEAFERLGIRQARGFLLFGPPGNGKTLLAKAVAREAEANFVATKSSDLLSKWVGESEKQVSKLFKRARQVSPTVIFIDEIDALAPARGGQFGDSNVTERVVNTLLAEMDGLEELQGVVVIGATNRPTLLDPALLRPGRFDELVYVPVPDTEGRRTILGIQTKDMPLADDVDLDAIAGRTERFSGADLENLVRKAGLLALRQNLDSETVSAAHFESALADTRPSVTPEVEREYERMRKQLKQEDPRGRTIGFQIAPPEGDGA
ncbi:CDC48 family AAA ATPase [Rubrivirga sp. S365]|uniref:CDC48 family AAA ATPase n=1 Tax=Rubrivirga litoralis TaxID=3075598 RepID=A0ABU3BQ02_9BACT|nr:MULTISPECIES: CDC48 family AAA ATPase [unclassified Rubrivirga]MDT0631369.1 CDC48 family AAA ATPase [Rubrivirga sp. F394]MDT7855960.1 CDC48 family AAA ATPase [Rubrivirga sp. S365]